MDNAYVLECIDLWNDSKWRTLASWDSRITNKELQHETAWAPMAERPRRLTNMEIKRFAIRQIGVAIYLGTHGPEIRSDGTTSVVLADAVQRYGKEGDINLYWVEVEKIMNMWGCFFHTSDGLSQHYRKRFSEKEEQAQRLKQENSEKIERWAQDIPVSGDGICRCYPEHSPSCHNYREPEQGICTGCRGGCWQCGKWA